MLQTTLGREQLASSRCLVQRNYRPTPDRVGVNYFFLRQGGQIVKSLFWMCGSAMLLKSRENVDLFRLPERWRRRLRMRLACSLASVSVHTQRHAHMHALYIVRIPPTPPDGSDISLPIFVEPFTSRWAYRKKMFLKPKE